MPRSSKTIVQQRAQLRRMWGRVWCRRAVENGCMGWLAFVSMGGLVALGFWTGIRISLAVEF
jgi:hypothetical protein